MSKGFRHGVELAKLATDAGRVTPHTLRHTASTWLMQAGVDLWAAAGFLGMTVETLERNYGHHHPDYLKSAADALSKGGHKSVSVAVSVAEKKAGREKLQNTAEKAGRSGRI